MVKIVTVGTNFVVDYFMDGALNTPEIEVVGACSRSEANAQRVADKYHLPKTYTSMEALAQDPEVDAVYLATPNLCHRDQTLMMLNAGKHVFLEKPAVTCLEDYQMIQSAAHAAGKVLLEAMRPVHGPGLESIRRQLDRLGPIRRVQLHCGKYSSRYTAFRNGEIMNAFDPSLQNSALMDMGVYSVQMLIALFGPPKAISARAIRLHNGFEAEGTIVCEYDGMLADITYGKISDSYRDNEIEGEDGALLFDSVGEPQTLKLYLRGEPGCQVYENVSGAHPMQYEVADFCAAVEGRLDIRPYQQWTEQTIRLMDEARRQTGVVFG